MKHISILPLCRDAVSVFILFRPLYIYFYGKSSHIYYYIFIAIHFHVCFNMGSETVYPTFFKVWFKFVLKYYLFCISSISTCSLTIYLTHLFISKLHTTTTQLKTDLDEYENTCMKLLPQNSKKRRILIQQTNYLFILSFTY